MLKDLIRQDRGSGIESIMTCVDQVEIVGQEALRSKE